MITSFRNKPLRDFFETGKSAKIPADLRKRVALWLDALDAARKIEDLDQHGFRLHPLKPTTCWAIDVNGPWRITFEWIAGNASAVDLEQYH